MNEKEKKERKREEMTNEWMNGNNKWTERMKEREKETDE